MKKSNPGFSPHPPRAFKRAGIRDLEFEKFPSCGGAVCQTPSSGTTQTFGRGRRPPNPELRIANPDEKFAAYERLLLEWSKKMNLVGRSTLSDIRKRHIEDCAGLEEHIPKTKTVIDLGSGAGFPAVVLAILGYDVAAVESVGKKCAFLEEVKRELGLFNLKIVNQRVENALPGIVNAAKNRKNLVFTARGFAPLIRILEMTQKLDIPYVLLKGEKAALEIAEARKKYRFDAELHPSKTGPGFIIKLTTF